MRSPRGGSSAAPSSRSGPPRAASRRSGRCRSLATVQPLVEISEEAQAALDAGDAVVALETTLVAHGFPAPDGIEVGLASEAAVREAGAVPATIGVLDTGSALVSSSELERFTPDARKAGPRDLAACAVQGAVGATTVGGALVVAAWVGIPFLGTGGVGGVHRGFPSPPDVSADLPALARTQALVVSSGVKSLLDVPATVELLETLGVPVLGFRTSTLPPSTPPKAGRPCRSASRTREAARVAAAHWSLGGGGLCSPTPRPQSVDVEDLIESAVSEAAATGVSGQAVTPFVLSFLHDRSDGRTREVNRALIVENARLAGEIAVAFAAS